MSTVSIIMVSYHTGPALWLGIDAALEQKECKELILVDNGNVPHDMERLRQLAAKDARLVLVSGHGNVGFAKGCNIGAKKATGDYILLLNPDAMLPEGGLARALEALSRYPERTLAGCFLANPDGSEQRGGRRAHLTPANAIAESMGLQRFLKGKEALYFHGGPLPEGAQEVPVISGAFMMLSRAFYTALGGMDENYFMHMEDADFCFRVHKAGGKVIFMPEVKVVHFLSTSDVPSAFVEKHKARGFIRYLRTHFSDQYPGAFLSLMAAGIWARCWLKIIFNRVDRLWVHPLVARQEIARMVLMHRLAHFGARDNSLQGQTVLVLGGSGQIGLCVAGKALARGARVIATWHKTRVEFTHPNLQWVQCNLADAPELEAVKADILIYAAALWLLPVALKKLSQAGLTRIIAFGSTTMLFKTDSKSGHEQDIAKRLEEAEKELLESKENAARPVTILRPTMVYGVGLDSIVTRMADVVRRFGFLPVYLPASGLRHPVQAMDLADAALGIIANPKTYGKAYNTGGSESITYRVMLETIFRRVGKKPRLINIPMMPLMLDALGMVYSFTGLSGDIARRMNRDQVFDIQPAKDDFGWLPQGFLEGEAVL